MDEALHDVLRRCVNSPVKLDLVLYLHDNPFAMDDARALALRLGREVSMVEASAEELVRDGVLVRLPGADGDGKVIYRPAHGSETAAQVSRLAAFCRHGGIAQVRAVIHDITIAEAVRTAIATSGRLSAREITVACSDGVVLLTGRVNTPGERAELDVLCERLSQSRYGMRAITDRVEVDRRTNPDDRQVRVRARAELAQCAEWNLPDQSAGPDADALYVDVEVIGGVAYLTGLVLTPQDRQRAADVTRQVPGVLDVVNWLDVRTYRST